MNEEKVFQETENFIEDAASTYAVPAETSGSSGLGKLIVVGAAVATLGVGALVIKNKDKIRDWRISRHEKKLAKLKERKAKEESKNSTEPIDVDVVDVE